MKFKNFLAESKAEWKLDLMSQRIFDDLVDDNEHFPEKIPVKINGQLLSTVIDKMNDVVFHDLQRLNELFDDDEKLQHAELDISPNTFVTELLYDKEKKVVLITWEIGLYDASNNSPHEIRAEFMFKFNPLKINNKALDIVFFGDSGTTPKINMSRWATLMNYNP